MITRTLGSRAALVAVAALGWWTGANAQNTAAGTPITNRATVNYTVGGLTQAPIESSPSGNVTPGVGAGIDTSFVVDNKVDLSVTEVSGNATTVTPGEANGVLAFTLLNEGNSPQGYQLTVTEESSTVEFTNTDNADFGLANLLIRIDEGNGTFDGTEPTATTVDVLNPNQSVRVFVVSPTVPLTLVNGNFVNVNLQARTAAPGPGGALLTASTGLNNPAAVEILFADPGLDAAESDTDQFAVVTAGLTISKAQTVLDDGFSSANPRAIPNALVEYTITVANTSTTTAADAIVISDPIPVTTTFQTGLYGGGDVAITGGVVATCVAETLADANTDGCFRNGTGDLVVGAAALGNLAPNGDSVTVAFRVRIK